MEKKSFEFAPGLLVCIVLAVASFFISKAPWVEKNLHFSPLLIVILLGIIVASIVKLPQALSSGISLAQKPILRWAVAGLGFKLSLSELAKIGGPSLLVVLISTVSALAFGWWLGKILGLTEKLSILLATGGAICGASAVVAADTVVQADPEEAAVSLGVITLWGTVGIFLFPLIGHAIAMTTLSYGVWAGTSLHELAQVVAAGNGFSEDAGKLATAVKLARICLLAPTVFYLAWWLRKNRGSSGEAKVAPVPFFLVLFVVFAAFTSIAPQLGLPKDWNKQLLDLVTLLLCIGMAGVGLKTGFRDIKKAGWKPVAVGLGQWVFLSLVALGLIVLLKV